MVEAKKGSKKKIVPISSYLTRDIEFKKYSKKIKKINKKHQYGFFSSQNGLVEVEKERKKILIPITSNMTWNRKLKKKIAKKIQEIEKQLYCFFSSQNGLGEAEKERKKNNYRSDQFLHDQE